MSKLKKSGSSIFEKLEKSTTLRLWNTVYWTFCSIKLMLNVMLRPSSIAVPNFMALSFQIREHERDKVVIFSLPKVQSWKNSGKPVRSLGARKSTSLGWVGLVPGVENPQIRVCLALFGQFLLSFVNISKTTGPISKILMSLDLPLQALRNGWKNSSI